MASLYNYRKKYYIAYHINGKRYTKSTQLDFVKANKAKAELAKSKIEKIEKENKLKIKYGSVVPKSKKNKVTLANAINDYLKTIRKTTSTGGQDNHSRTFLVVMRQFQEDIQPETDVTIISRSDISTFVKRKEIEISNASLQTYIRYLKGFFNYLVEEEIIDKSPIAKRVIPKSVTKPINTFLEEDIELILECAKQKSSEYFIIYKFLLLTGIRPGDIFEIRAGDFNFKSKIIRLRISKTKRSIDFPIYTELEKFLNEKIVGIVKMPSEEKVFKLYSVNRIGKTFRKILKELGLHNKRYNLKTFRKTFASSLADRGLSEGDLADLLGHSSTATTRAFYKSKNAGAIRSRIEALDK
ncbi:MAG TPA: site-specific integrase [Ignavibacteria bacterium]|nr:site-specific integrase [Ignavibacteria bacterium]HMR41372.1 site-specific integrase [Ignavibacteria bacterium]